AHKSRRVAGITAAGLGAVAEGGRALTPKQREALALLAGTPAGFPIPSLVARGIGADTVARLTTHGLVAVRHERIDRDPFDAGAVPMPAADLDRPLTAEQRMAVARLSALARTQEFRVALLQGVTGSGKTEIYLRLAAEVAPSGRGTLVLVPEIALTPALASLFHSAFRDRVAIQHSGLSDGERHDQWQRIRSGDVSIVVGTRSAVFAPLPKVRLIVVDE